MSTEKMIIAIDGPAASGKGSIARELADRFGFAYLDTGKLYRLIGLNVLNQNIDPENEDAATKVAQELVSFFRPDYLDNPDLGLDEAGNAASQVAVHHGVREALIDLQRQFPETVDAKGAVIDGRDIGTVIFPDADIKFFVTADLEERAGRRFKELERKGREADYEAIYQDMKQRDERDSGRAHAPTAKADDAIELDTTSLSVEEAADKIAPYILKLSKKSSQKA